VVSFALAISMTVLWRWERTRHGFELWTLGLWLFVGGMILLLARPVLPESISILFGNGGVFATPVLLRAGLQRYRNRPIAVVPDSTFAALAAVGLVVLFIAGAGIDQRVAVGAAAISILTLRCLPETWAPPGETRLAFRMLSAVLAVIGAAAAGRAVVALNGTDAIDSPFQGNLLQDLLYAALSLSAILLPFALLILNSLRNLEQLKKAQARAEAAAATDYLTGLPNRRHMFHELDLLNTHSPIAIAVLDIDDFKRINDCCGHSTGDRVLAQLGGILREATRDGEVPVRLGGEEFALISLTGTWERHCELAARLCRRVSSELASRAGIEMQVTCSVGVAHGYASDVDAVLGYADAALYEAKRTGKNRVVTNPEIALPGTRLEGPRHVSYRVTG
jgi:diguanylate cyclase (GGDEF)-like protein